MGGMLALEYAFFGQEYVKSIVAIATCAEHSAWCIAWSEMQRQSICADPKFQSGQYKLRDPPHSGLAAARVAALLTYRSRDSYQRKFARTISSPAAISKKTNANRQLASVIPPQSGSISEPLVRKERRASRPRQSRRSPRRLTEKDEHLSSQFSVKTYLRYQGNKFVHRFDSNCYIAITRKLDSHDISRGRIDNDDARLPQEQALAQIQQPVLVIGIESDVLFPCAEQMRLAEGIPNAQCETIASSEGHDAFLISATQVGHLIHDFLHSTVDCYE